MKPERWGSQLVQEKYQEEKASNKIHPYRIIIIIIIIRFKSCWSPRFITPANDIHDMTLTPFQKNCASAGLFTRVGKIPTNDNC